MARARRASTTSNASAGAPAAVTTGAGRGRGRRRGRSGRSDARLAEIVERYVSDLIEALTAEVRRSVADEVSAVLTGAGRGYAGRGRRALPARKRVLPCIAPNCSNPSKGPRFHYLCDKHKDAKKQDYETWRKARKEKQAA